MSTLSKIFVVLNLVLSILFATFVTHFYKNAQNWRAKHDLLQEDSAKVKRELEGKVQGLEEMVKGKNDQIAAQTATLHERDAQLARAAADNSKLSADLLKTQEDFRSQRNAVERLTAEVERKSKDIKDMASQMEANRQAKEDAIQKMKQAMDAAHEWELQVNVRDSQLIELRTRIMDLDRELQQHQIIMNELAHMGFDIAKIAAGAVPDIEGRVTCVKSGVVMISVGSDDQVREGYEFTVYRDGAYLCRIRVDKVFPDQAAGEVIPESIRPEANGQVDVQGGDRVSTRL